MSFSCDSFLRHLFSQPQTGVRKSICPRFLPRLERLEDRLAPATFIVKTAGDAAGKVTLVARTVDTFTAPTLRAAIAASQTTNPGAAKVNTILFQIGNGLQSIMVGSQTQGAALPDINKFPVVIDATETAALPKQVIEINGSNAVAGANGLTITIGGSKVRSLVINGFRAAANGMGGNGILLSGKGGNAVERNFIGTDADGKAAKPNEGNGILIQSGSSGNTIGGATADKGNVISGNDQNGVEILGFDSSGNKVQGNRIGTNARRSDRVPNQGAGVFLNGAANNTIGGVTALQGKPPQPTPGTAPGNQISGNRLSGVVITGQSATGNMVLGNLIGTNKDGDDAVANTEDGITIVDAPKNTIGGTVAGARNIISGNLGRNEGGMFVGGNGIRITGQAATGNQVLGNFIGTGVDGSFEVPNRRDGVQIDDASGNTVGGPTAAARNVISGNKGNGVSIMADMDEDQKANDNTVQGNFIGTRENGLDPLGNRGDGINVSGTANGNVIGSGSASRPGSPPGNVISGNTGDGVRITGSVLTFPDEPDKEPVLLRPNDNYVQGNLIGTDKNGDAALGNATDGVVVDAAVGTYVAFNVISDNGNGVKLTNDAEFTQLVYNLIGTDITSKKGRGNVQDGVLIDNASNNTVGPRNVISANKRNGVRVTGADAIGNKVQGNLIGTQGDGATPLRNDGAGVSIENSAKRTQVSRATNGPVNIIAFNGGDGVFIEQGALNNTIANARIISNVEAGIRDENAALSNVFTQNSITGNGKMGIDVDQAGVTDVSLPTLSSAQVDKTNITIKGSLSGSAKNSMVTIEFFSNAQADNSQLAQGHGQGDTFIGSITVETDGNGNSKKDFTATFSINQSDLFGKAVTIAKGNFISATATSPDMKNGQPFGTSEFSKCSLVTASVAQANPTITTVVSSLNPSAFGQLVAFTATVTPVSAATGTPTDTVQFQVDGINFGAPVPLTTGRATSASLGTLSPGPHTITADYTGDGSFAASAGTFLQTVYPANTITQISSDHQLSVYGELITFTASVAAVTPGAGTPTGSVTFESRLPDGTVVTLGTAPVDANGTAVVSVANLVPASHTIFAVYQGDSNFTTSTSGDITVTVERAGTTLTIASSNPVAVAGSPVNFTATLAVVPPGSPLTPATGTITFSDTFEGTTTVLAVITLGGPPGMSPALTTVGTHLITAVYSGDSFYNGSTSPAITETIVPGTSPAPPRGGAGSTVSAPFSTVTLSTTVAGLPLGHLDHGYGGPLVLLAPDGRRSAQSADLYFDHLFHMTYSDATRVLFADSAAGLAQALASIGRL